MENSSYRGYCSTVLNSPESDRVIRYIKLIRVRFHYPFATTTTVMSPVNKKEPINGFPCILNFPVHIGRIYKLTLISSYMVTIRRHITKPERTFTFHNPADLSFLGMTGSTFHVSATKYMNILHFKMFKMSIGCKILVLLLIESPREFELAERNFISHFSIG